MDEPYFSFLQKNYPKDWGFVQYELLPVDSERKPYSSWKEVYENYRPRFQTAPQDIFDLMILYIPIDKIQVFINNYCRFDPNACSKEKNFWKSLWLRDMNNKIPINIKEKYLDFIDSYNKREDIQNKLDLAFAYNAVHLLPSLIANGADITKNWNWGFRDAAENGYLEILKFYIENNIDVSENLNMALYLASRYGHLNVVKYLIEKGADYKANKYHAYITAVEGGHLDIVKYFVEEIGIDIAMKNYVALERAATVGIEGQLDIVKYFIEKGADISYNDFQIVKMTEVHGHYHILEYFIELGIDPEILKSSTRRKLGI